ncbi:hypothetical protein, partial [Staphylococcus aureus]
SISILFSLSSIILYVSPPLGVVLMFVCRKSSHKEE